MSEIEKIYEAINNKDRNSLANVIISLYNKLGIKVPYKINLCRYRFSKQYIFLKRM